MSDDKSLIHKKIKFGMRGAVAHRLLKDWWLEINDYRRDYIEFSSDSVGRACIRVISVMSWFSESLRE
jgi:hypothetical protein